MSKNKTLIIAAAIAISVIGLAVGIILLARMKIISFEMAMLMLAAVMGMYVGFGVLIAVYRLIDKLEKADR